jgi:hypothetical protein
VLDIATIVEELFGGHLGTIEGRAFILEHLRRQEPDQVTGDIVLRTYENEASVISTASSDTGTARQIIIAEVKGDTYVLVIYGSPARYGEREASFEEIVRTAQEVALVFIDEYLMTAVAP